MAGSGGSSSSGTSNGSSDTGALIRHLLGVVDRDGCQRRARRPPPADRLTEPSDLGRRVGELLGRTTWVPSERHGAESDEDEGEVGDVNVILQHGVEREQYGHQE